MSAPVLRPVSWRYLLVSLGFSALATVRFLDGALIWGLVFTIAATINVGLSFGNRQSRKGQQETPLPDGDSLVRSWQLHHDSTRRWRILTGASIAVAAGLLPLHPPFAVLAAITALFCLFRARRTRLDAGTLRRTIGAVRNPAEKP